MTLYILLCETLHRVKFNLYGDNHRKITVQLAN
jgi:hypothetical protein